MAVFFTTVVIFDGWLDGSLTGSVSDDGAVKGTVFCVLIAVLAIPAQLEFARLAGKAGLKIFTPLAIVASILFATSWYWRQFILIPVPIYLSFLFAISLLALFTYQAIRYGTKGVIGNCGANCFSILYIGLLSSFVLAVRIDFGPWCLLMFVFAVKSGDIGAYTAGRIFGKHKFSPQISPGKTWEGMGGAAVFAAIVGSIFAVGSDIMSGLSGAIFGFVFALLGQLGDLAESMIKRDAEQKDSANNVPGFGGILDIVDSPLVTAPFAYLFFSLICQR